MTRTSRTASINSRIATPRPLISKIHRTCVSSRSRSRVFQNSRYDPGYALSSARPSMTPASTASSLYEAFATVPDLRSRFGRSYILASPLTLADVTMLYGCRSLHTIALWGRDYNHLASLLGFTRPTKDRRRYRTPCTSALHTVFAALDPDAFEAALTACPA
jgi:hypothetical protein